MGGSGARAQQYPKRGNTAKAFLHHIDIIHFCSKAIAHSLCDSGVRYRFLPLLAEPELTTIVQ
jgi:hypothetical protein